jgi:hypothetical protein
MVHTSIIFLQPRWRGRGRRRGRGCVNHYILIVVLSAKEKIWMSGAIGYGKNRCLKSPTTLSITTLSVMTFSIAARNLMTLGIMTEHSYAKCHLCWVSLMFISNISSLYWVSLFWMTLRRVSKCWLSWHHLESYSQYFIFFVNYEWAL